ncbi:hypothetical protein TWF730_008635 [Orbilia blumenaviensis]|uniref:Peptide-O-fucosyltransferase n=1 Tax=Orbilia blumenaviensis TaxID=1796055 RepID=A0AAV9V6S2_9PEZI
MLNRDFTNQAPTMLNKVLIGIQNKSPRRSVYSLVLWTGLTFIFVSASTYFISQSRPAVDYFTHHESTYDSSANTNGPNPLLTTEGIDQFIHDHAYPRLGESANFTGLRQVCDSTKWQKNVYFTCTHNLGGLINVRNMVLNCVRYAIAAGASGLILPLIEARDPTVLSRLKTGEYQSMQFLFDEDWFKKVMKTNCRQMELLDTIEDVPHYRYATMPDLMNVQSFMGQPPGSRQGRMRNRKPEDFRPRFDALIKSQSKRPGERNPVIVRLDDRTLFSWPPSFDSPAFANYFGFILEFRLDLTALANIIVSRVRPTSSSGASKDPYVGVHLRSEADAGKYWASWDQLANATLSAAVESDIKHIYVASGDTDGVAKLAKKAAESGIKVLDKWGVLLKNEKEYLKPFRFDQLAIVDYLTLLESDRFVGSGQSSFSSHILMRREFIANNTLSTDTKNDNGKPRDQFAGPGRLAYWDQDWP